MNKHLIVIYDNIQRILMLFSGYDHSLKPYVIILPNMTRIPHTLFKRLTELRDTACS